LNARGNFDDLIGGKEAIDHETEVANEAHHDQISPKKTGCAPSAK
jgi:hypothetical protein